MNHFLTSLVVGLCVISGIHAVSESHTCGDPTLSPVLGGADLVDMWQRHASSNGEVIPRMGFSQYSFKVGDYSFLFVSASNRDIFATSPNKYVPELGGYCAWGLTGYDEHITDPSGYGFGGACLNSTTGNTYYGSDIHSFWFLNEEARQGFENEGEGLKMNVQLAKQNYENILLENNAKYCFNTDKLKTCD